MSDAFTKLFQQMMQSGQEMARAFNPALETFDPRAFHSFTTAASTSPTRCTSSPLVTAIHAAPVAPTWTVTSEGRPSTSTTVTVARPSSTLTADAGTAVASVISSVMIETEAVEPLRSPVASPVTPMVTG